MPPSDAQARKPSDVETAPNLHATILTAKMTDGMTANLKNNREFRPQNDVDKHRAKGSPTAWAPVWLLSAFSAATVAAGTVPGPVLRVELNGRGAIALEARDATLSETLEAVASKAGFEVVMDEGIQRPPVNLSLSPSSVEEVLHHVLHGRNYALLYEADDSQPTRVIVLPPSSPSRQASASQSHGRPRRH